MAILAALTVALSSMGVASSSQMLWGAYAGGGQYGQTDAPWDMRSAQAFERNAGKRMSLLEWGQAWFECSSSCGWRPFRRGLFRRFDFLLRVGVQKPGRRRVYGRGLSARLPRR